jgi:deazaflavin-dependent oxidoreductase (nitroreductase family)
MSTETRSEDLYGDEHVRVYRETGGQVGYHWKNNSEILLLTTKGRKSGDERTHALIFREIGGDYVIVASKGGHPQHPAWFLNMEANPEDIQIQVMDEVFKVRHRVSEDPERENLWEAMNEAWPPYAEYQTKTDRQIPVVVLERA